MNCKKSLFLNSLNVPSPHSLDHLPFYFPDGATIDAITETVVVNPGEEAKLSCNVRGKDEIIKFSLFGQQLI